MPCGNGHQDATCIALDDTAHQLCTGWSDGANDMIYWINPHYEPPKVLEKGSARRQATEMAARVPPTTSVRNPHQEAAEGTERASQSWTTDQRRAVFDAVLAVAEAKKRFTADDVWEHLGDSVPMTMGIAAILRRAVSAGHIKPTSEFAYSSRPDRQDHDYGRHLRVWASTSLT